MIWTVLGGLYALVVLVELGRARARLKRWPVLASSTNPVPADLRFFIAPGVVLNESVRRAAAAHLRAEGLDALDLVPFDLDIASVLEVADAMDPSELRRNPFARIAGAGHVLVARSELVERAGAGEPSDTRTIAALAETLRRFAVERTGSAIAPGLAAVREAPEVRACVMRARVGAGMGPLLYLQGVRWVLLAATFASNLRVGFAVAALASVLPSLAVTGYVRSDDLLPSMILRLPRDLLRWIRGCLQLEALTFEIASARPVYVELLADGTDPFFEPRRTDCLVCGSSNLAQSLVTTDLMQRKPGRFVIERCDDCSILFQNPRLSARGLDFYYRDFYDGINAEIADELFASTRTLYTARAALVATAPSRWLDVGCGHAHFALEARRCWPSTDFEGLDRSASVDEALARGWIKRAWHEGLEEMAESGGHFDVISLFHYLEHTQDPAAEIAAAARLLTPEGRLLIELPNPQCRLGRWLGRWWFPWFQPQHQCFLDERALARLLAVSGLKTVFIEYIATADDILLGALLAVRRACSPGDVPWALRPSLARRALDVTIWGLATPLLALAAFIGALYGTLPASQATSNALRVVAARANTE